MDYNEYLALRLSKLADGFEKQGVRYNDQYCLGYATALRDLSGLSNRAGDLAIYHNEWKKL